MPTVEQLQDDLETLRQVRSTGALEVQYSDGARVRFRSDAELLAAMGDLERRIASATGTTPVHTIAIHSSKGLDS